MLQLGNTLNEGSARAGAKGVAMDGERVNIAIVLCWACGCYYMDLTAAAGLAKLKELKINQNGPKIQQQHQQYNDFNCSNALQ